jgi:hypothetical protein
MGNVEGCDIALDYKLGGVQAAQDECGHRLDIVS